MDLFEAASRDELGLPKSGENTPLAVAMRPKTIEELVGQDALLAPNAPLRLLLDPTQVGPASVILWGPPGTGKTTIAYLVARAGGRGFVELSALTSGVKDVRDVVARAKRDLATSGKETVLFVDEVHRFSKSQQDSLLAAVENRWVILLAATTENPVFSVISPLLSRSLVLHLAGLDTQALGQVIDRALSADEGLGGRFSLSEAARDTLIRLAGSDARKVLTLLEAAAKVKENQAGAGPHAAGGLEQNRVIEQEDVTAAANTARMSYGVDQHYDVASAFIKSMRGSDPDAALHYLARMLVAGEDPRFIARRIMICASEDVGMAAPEVLPLTVAAAQAVALVGMPEARIILSQAVIAVATAAKSNRAYLAINQAMADVKKGKGGPIPLYLRDQHYPGAEADRKNQSYIYPHDDPGGIVPQQYLPDDLRQAIYYEPSAHGYESNLGPRLAKMRNITKAKDAKPGDREVE